MPALVVYDTTHGNTKEIAHAIADGLSGEAEVVVKRMGDVDLADVQAADLVVVGCPVHAWNMSRGARDFLSGLGSARFEGKRAAAFDTKFQSILAGGAARKLARNLEQRGFEMVAPAQSFFVAGMEGPLKEGELDRARAFGATLARGGEI